MDYLQAILDHKFSIILIARKTSEQISNVDGWPEGTIILLGNDVAKELV